jgi:hypothetical protein
MVEHTRRDLRNWQAFLTEYNRKRMEIGMKWNFVTQRYENDPVVPDSEAAETRGGFEYLYGGATAAVDDTLTERGKNYGNFTDNADYAQQIKQVFQDARTWREMPAYMQEALDLIASKLGRLLSGNPYHKDGWHDIQGYAKLVEDRI